MATQNRAQASAAARRAAQLNQLNNIGSDRTEFDTANMFSVVDNVVGDFISRVHDNVNKTNDFIVTGEILDIKSEVSDKGINVVIPNHLLFQDKGVNGSKVKKYNTQFTYRDLRPPISVFIDYVKTKNIQLRDEELYDGQPSRFAHLDEDQKIKNAAYGIREKIYQEGFKPRDVYSKEIPKLITDIQESVTDYLSLFLQQQIVNNDGTRTTIT